MPNAYTHPGCCWVGSGAAALHCKQRGKASLDRSGLVVAGSGCGSGGSRRRFAQPCAHSSLLRLTQASEPVKDWPIRPHVLGMPRR